MVPDQPVDWQKKLPALFDLFAAKRNWERDNTSPLCIKFFQKSPDEFTLGARKFRETLQDPSFFAFLFTR
jgi:hypothetical protein